MEVSKWETILVLEKGDETRNALLPLDIECSFEEIIQQLKELRDQHQGNYDELRFYFTWKSFGHGARNEWYELQGRYIDPAKITLYGSKV